MFKLLSVQLSFTTHFKSSELTGTFQVEELLMQCFLELGETFSPLCIRQAC